MCLASAFALCPPLRCPSSSTPASCWVEQHGAHISKFAASSLALHPPLNSPGFVLGWTRVKALWGGHDVDSCRRVHPVSLPTLHPPLNSSAQFPLLHAGLDQSKGRVGWFDWNSGRGASSSTICCSAGHSFDLDGLGLFLLACSPLDVLLLCFSKVTSAELHTTSERNVQDSLVKSPPWRLVRYIHHLAGSFVHCHNNIRNRNWNGVVVLEKVCLPFSSTPCSYLLTGLLIYLTGGMYAERVLYNSRHDDDQQYHH
jgi:hypothetical protein